ncbi:MAG: OmpA family protein, partial [Bacteroidetes bacterium]|nr:OmpA family protein [Bacteroidota bacterium]
QVQAPTVCATVFDDDNYLCALDLRVDSTFNLPDARLTDSMLSAIARKAERPEQPAQELKMRKRDRWLKAELDAINQRLDQVDQRKELWALRDRMDDIEGRLDDLSLHVDELDRDRRVPGGSENPLAGLSRLTGRNLAVAFEPGSSELGPLQQQLLSEVVDAMARDAAGRVLLTGQADPTGDPARNMALSERRAKAVRNFLLARGIGPDRVLLNYSGSGAGGAERRVVLEWLR